jgi:hypothetical protein
MNNDGVLYSERQTEERGDLARRICRRHTFSEVASEKQRPQGTLGMPCAAKTTGAGDPHLLRKPPNPRLNNELVTNNAKTTKIDPQSKKRE